jgi:glycosyltransferase involved in cell wall biosynthesis
MHGRALVNQAVVDALSTACVPLKAIDTSPGTLRRDPIYYARRIASFALKAIPTILGAEGDVVYTDVEPGPGMWFNLVVILFGRTKRLGIVLHHHSALYTKAFERRFDWVSRLAGKRALHIVLDEFMARDIEAKYPHGVAIVHNASHVARPARLERNHQWLTCGFLSNLSSEKGLEVFLDCLRSARAAGLNLQAILAGPPTTREAEQTIADAKLEFGGMLSVLGPVANSRKEAFFRSIDIFLFPTFYRIEAQPLVILEAMSYGVTVVSSDQGYCAELVGEAGASAPIADFKRTAISFLARCSEDSEYLQTMRTKTQARFERLKAEGEVQKNDMIGLMMSS